MKRIEVEPGSDGWRRARLGMPTASGADRIITATGKPSNSRTKYMHELIAERLLGTWLDDNLGGFVARGSFLEAEAVAFYEFTNDTATIPGGFCTTDDGRAGCSPDRIVTTTRGLEIKCPKASTHIGYMLEGAHLTDYKIQVQFSMWVTGFDEWDLLSYNPELPPALLRVKRDEPFIRLLGDRVREFCDELDELHKRAEALREQAA
jgi:hypothetical protein